MNAFEWVRQGHFHYSGIAKDECPYCMQPLPTKFEEEFAKCFNAQFAEDCAKLAKFEIDYSAYITNTFIEPLKWYIRYIPQTGYGDLLMYEEQLELIVKTLELNIQRIKAKIEKPSEPIELESVKKYVEKVNSMLESTNAIFKQNNDIYDNQEKQAELCIEQVFELLAFEFDDVKKKLDEDTKKIESEIVEIEKRVAFENSELGKLKAQLGELTNDVGGTSATVGKINALLEKSGFRGFRLSPRRGAPDKYEIIREVDGNPAEKLSEGERNFIAFLYFYYFVQGAWHKEDLVKNKIVVIGNYSVTTDFTVPANIPLIVSNTDFPDLFTVPSINF